MILVGKAISITSNALESTLSPGSNEPNRNEEIANGQFRQSIDQQIKGKKANRSEIRNLLAKQVKFNHYQATSMTPQRLEIQNRAKTERESL